MIVKKAASGEWTVHRQVAPSGARKIYRDWFLVKSTGGKGGKLSLNQLMFPRELYGKKVRLKIEVLEERKTWQTMIAYT